MFYHVESIRARILRWWESLHASTSVVLFLAFDTAGVSWACVSATTPLICMEIFRQADVSKFESSVALEILILSRRSLLDLWHVVV